MKVPTGPNMTSEEVKVIMTHLYTRCEMINGDAKLQRGALALEARNFKKSRCSIRNVWQLFWRARFSGCNRQAVLQSTFQRKSVSTMGSNDKRIIRSIDSVLGISESTIWYYKKRGIDKDCIVIVPGRSQRTRAWQPGSWEWGVIIIFRFYDLVVNCSDCDSGFPFNCMWHQFT